MHVIGTAGHVDHGKSTLIAALTGTHPDRLKEEQEREMTIDLGFAWLTLPDGEEVGIVDVPGHRDFIENMLAGVGGIEAVLLVIAADEGVMPQTREHLAILDLLKVRAGIVVLTKIDLVDDPEWLALTEADIRSALRSTVLEDAPIVRVSACTGAGLPELLQTLSQLLQKSPPRPDVGRPRLPVDRVFTMTGFGTVVTGTLSDGSFIKGEEVEFLPGGLRGRIRGLQTHRKKEENAVPGSRTAINLAGIEVEQVHRGEVVTRPGQYLSTQRVDVHFRLLPDVSAPLQHHTQIKLFIGTAEIIADVRLLGTEVLQPGDSGWLQLELHQPALAVRGDRYILRRPSPGETLGGGVIVEAAPVGRHKRFDMDVIQRLESLLQGTPAEVLLQASLALGPATVKEVIAHSHLDSAAAALALEELTAGEQVLQLDDLPLLVDSNTLVMPLSQWQAMKDMVTKALTTYHQSYPLRRGMPREELKSRLKLHPRIFNLILLKLAGESVITAGEKWAAIPAHRVLFSPFQQLKVDKLMEQFTAAPFAPPVIKECKLDVGEDVFNTLVEAGDLVAVSDEIVFRKIDYEAMVEKIRQALQQKGQLTLAEARDLFSTSRRYVQALLEHLDACSITIREGDYRKLK
jgi:selenocysteine-specific elongation factor